MTCEYLDISDATLLRYAKKGILTRYPIGPSVRYDLNEIDALLRNGATPGGVAASVIARIRAALPQGTGRPLIPLTQVHAAIDKVAAELGVES